MGLFKKKSKEEKQKRKEQRKKKRKERRKKRREKLKKTLLIPFKPLMRKLVKKKGQTPSKDINILANQVYELYLKKNFEKSVTDSYSVSGDAVNHAIPPIPPELIPTIVDFLNGLFAKKEKDGTTGDPELDKEIDNAKEAVEKVEKQEKEKERESKSAGGLNLNWGWILGGLAGFLILIVAIKFLFKNKSS